MLSSGLKGGTCHQRKFIWCRRSIRRGPSPETAQPIGAGREEMLHKRLPYGFQSRNHPFCEKKSEDTLSL